MNFCTRAQFIILYLGTVKEILFTKGSIFLHHWCLKTGQGHRGSFGLLSPGSQALVAVNIVYEGTWTAVTQGWHSRAIQNSESDVFKTHSFGSLSLENAFKLNTAYTSDSIKPIQWILWGQIKNHLSRFLPYTHLFLLLKSLKHPFPFCCPDLGLLRRWVIRAVRRWWCSLMRNL